MAISPFAIKDWTENTKRETGGTGLGLAVVARLAREQGFVFDVVSTPGRGSTFGVAVPRGPADAGGTP